MRAAAQDEAAGARPDAGVAADGTGLDAADGAATLRRADASAQDVVRARASNGANEADGGAAPSGRFAGHAATSHRVAGQLDTDGQRLAPPTAPAEIARAKRLVARGANLYRRGDYEPAEEAIKEAMTLYPFLAEANLLLGKIFLIRGAATLDRTLIDQAQRMFQMARKLDPSLQESDLLLELFAPPAGKTPEKSP